MNDWNEEMRESDRVTLQKWLDDFKKKTTRFLVGGLNPSEKYESRLGWFFPIYGKIIQLCSKPPTRI